MDSAFESVSMRITIGAEYFPYDQRYLFGPEPFDKPALRHFIHETLHFWQLFGSSFVSACALGEWRSLVEFESTGKLVAPSLQLTDEDPLAGFTAKQLQEALCRYWDVHIVGPHSLLGEPAEGTFVEKLDLPEWVTAGLDQKVIDKASTVYSYSGEQFDSWMLQEDSYAGPYKALRSKFNSYESAILFPILAYFALQAPRPCAVYLRSIERITGNKIPYQSSINEAWRNLFLGVASFSRNASFVQTGHWPANGRRPMEMMAAEGNSLAGHYLSIFDFMGRVIAGASSGDDKAQEIVEATLALPGEPSCRFMLAMNLTPALIELKGGSWHPYPPGAVFAAQEPVAGASPVLGGERLVELSEQMHERWKALQLGWLLKGDTPTKHSP